MEQKNNSKGKIITANALIAAIFWAVGIVFILYAVLPREKKHVGRKLSQFMIGVYFLVLLGNVLYYVTAVIPQSAPVAAAAQERAQWVSKPMPMLRRVGG